MGKTVKECLADSCERPPITKGLCTMHYQRLNNNWSTQDPKSIESRFWAKCSIEDSGCWEWGGYLNPAGYGQFGVEAGKVMLTHRWTYLTFRGDLIDGMHIDHLCRNPKCCNPDHLEQVTPQENAARTAGHKHTHYAIGNRTHCKWGHEMTPENSYRRPGRVNSYSCRRCHVLYSRNWEQRNRGSADE